MPRISYERQLAVLSPKRMAHLQIILIGAGGIGSPVALTLAKMGIPRIDVWDFDTVEEHNLPNQMYRLSDIGKPKAEAIKDLIAEYAPTRVRAFTSRYGKGSPPLRGIVISAVDSMDARREIWDEVRDNPEVPLYIEGRMGLEILQVNTLAKPLSAEDIERYEGTLYDSAHAVHARCTERAIIYTVMQAAATIGSQIKKFIRGEEIVKGITVDLKNQLILLE